MQPKLAIFISLIFQLYSSGSTDYQFCTQQHLQLIRPYFIRIAEYHSLSFLTHPNEISGFNCFVQKIFSITKHSDRFHFKIVLKQKQEFIQPECDLDIFFKINNDPKSNTFEFMENQEIVKYQVEIDDLFSQVQKRIRKNNCILLMKNESDYSFKSRLQQKFKQIETEINDQVHRSLMNQIESIQAFNETNSKTLQKTIYKRCLSEVLIDRFPFYYFRIDVFKYFIDDIQEPQIDDYFKNFLIENENIVLKKLQKSEAFKTILTKQVDEEMHKALDETKIDGKLKKMYPKYQEELQTGIVDFLMSTAVLETAYRYTVSFLSFIIRNTFGKIWNQFLFLFKKYQQKWLPCKDFEELNLEQIIHQQFLNWDYVSYSQCVYQEIQLADQKLGYQFSMDIQGDKECHLRFTYISVSNNYKFLPNEYNEVQCDDQLSIEQLKDKVQTDLEEQSFKTLSSVFDFSSESHEELQIDENIFDTEGVINIQAIKKPKKNKQNSDSQSNREKEQDLFGEDDIKNDLDKLKFFNRLMRKEKKPIKFLQIIIYNNCSKNSSHISQEHSCLSIHFFHILYIHLLFDIYSYLAMFSCYPKSFNFILLQPSLVPTIFLIPLLIIKL